MKNDRQKLVAFIDESVRDAFLKLKEGRFEDKQLAENMEKAFLELKANPLAGIHIPMKNMPKYYVKKYGIDNIRKYDLPNAWRLIYTLRGSEAEIVSVILEWFDHTLYNRRFGYRSK